jgi:hypothetical protein
MSDFLTRLALRQLGQIATIEPRVAPLYSTINEFGNGSFAGAAEDSHANNAIGAVDERAKTQASPLPTAHAYITADLARLPLAQERVGLPVVRSQLERPHAPTEPLVQTEALATEVSKAGPARSTADRPPTDGYAPGQPETTAALPRNRFPVVQSAREEAAAPIPLLKPARSNSAQSVGSLTPLVRLVGEKPTGEQVKREEAQVHVTIGRIEVSAAAAPAKRAPAPRKQTMSLDDYLARRQGKER